MLAGPSVLFLKGFATPSPVVWLKQGYHGLSKLLLPQEAPKSQGMVLISQPRLMRTPRAPGGFPQALSTGGSGRLASSDTVVRSPSTLNLRSTMLDPILDQENQNLREYGPRI